MLVETCKGMSVPCVAFSFLNAVMMVKLMQYDLVWVGRYDCTVNGKKKI